MLSVVHPPISLTVHQPFLLLWTQYIFTGLPYRGLSLRSSPSTKCFLTLHTVALLTLRCFTMLPVVCPAWMSVEISFLCFHLRNNKLNFGFEIYKIINKYQTFWFIEGTRFFYHQTLSKMYFKWSQDYFMTRYLWKNGQNKLDTIIIKMDIP